MTTLRKTPRLAAVTAIALTVSAAAATAADVGAVQVTGAGPAPLVVVSNGQDYTKLQTFGNFTMNVNIKYSVGAAGRIHSWEVKPKLESNFGIASIAPGLATYGKKQYYGVGDRPKSININTQLTIPLAKMANWVVGICQWKAEALRNSGKSNKQIFGQDRQVSFNAGVSYNIVAKGSGSGNPIYEVSSPNEIVVVCKKWGGAAVPQASGDLAGQAVVEEASLKVEPLPTTNGQCKVKLTGLVRLNRANYKGSARFEHGEGAKSEVISFTTAGNRIASVNRIVEIPKKKGPEIGAFMMRVLSPKAQTNFVPYAMSCSDIGGFAAKPKS